MLTASEVIPGFESGAILSLLCASGGAELGISWSSGPFDLAEAVEWVV